MQQPVLVKPSLIKNLRYQTPYFLISRKELKNNYRNFKKNFPGAKIFYAMKANSERAVLDTLHKLGSGFEVASVGELDLLKKIKVPAKNIAFGSAIKPAESIKEFFEYGVDLFAFDSLQELQKIAANAPGSRVYLRVRALDAGSVFKFSEKFGAEVEDVSPLLIKAKEMGLKASGVSFHVGSQAGNPRAWAQNITLLKPHMNVLNKMGVHLEFINIGGGFPCNYASTEEEIGLEEIAKHVYAAHRDLPYQPKLFLEPGRGIAASAAVLIAKVIARVQRPNSTWLFLDAGVYNALFETMAYQGSTRYHITSLRHQYSAGEKMFSIAGPTGDSPDVITREAHLPEDIDTGDKLMFHCVGAYSMSVTSNFNGFHKPAIRVI